MAAKAKSPTQRTLDHCRKRGWRVQVVERWVPQCKRRVDLFGVIDLVALDMTTCTVIGIQTTAASSMSARVHKIFDEPAVRDWLACGCRLVIHGWGKRGARDKRKLWSVREIEVRLDMGALVTEELTN